MSSELSTRHVSKFDGSNFLGWKFQMTQMFVAYDIFDVVNGDRVMPANSELAEGKTDQRQCEGYVCHIVGDGIYSARASPNVFHCKRNVGQTRNDLCV